MSPSDKQALLDSLSPEEKARLYVLAKHRKSLRERAVSWRESARWKQLPPWLPGGGGETYIDKKTGRKKVYRYSYLQGGRMAGKTWAGSRTFVEMILLNGPLDKNGNPREYAIVAPKHGQAWRVCVAGPSGILSLLGGKPGPRNPDTLIASMNENAGRIELKDGVIIHVTGAIDGATNIEGLNLSGLWGDEVGLWWRGKWEYAWKNAIRPAVRIKPARVILTGTPKRGHPFIRYIRDDQRFRLMVMPSMDNVENIDEESLEDLESDFGGTSVGAQELQGEFLDNVEGALFSRDDLDASALVPFDHEEIEAAKEKVRARLRRSMGPERYAQIIVSWDPAVTNTDDSDEHGIIVVATDGGDRPHYYVLDDFSLRASPDKAARVAARAAATYGAERVIVEGTQGQDTWLVIMGTVSPETKIEKVQTGNNNKVERAQLSATLAEQHRLHMVDTPSEKDDEESRLDTLKEQLTTWVPESSDSPDRMDAMAHGINWLAKKHSKPKGGSRLVGTGESSGKGRIARRTGQGSGGRAARRAARAA